jgi:hypothetical protein
MRNLSPAEVRDFLRGARFSGLPPPKDTPPAVSRPLSAASYWGRWGSEPPGDPGTFPRREILPGGAEYNESTVFNGKNGAATPADAPSFSPTVAAGIPEGAVAYVSSAIFTPFPFTVGTASRQISPVIVPKNPSRAALLMQNLSAATNLFINFGAPANVNLGFIIVPGGAALFDQFTPINDIYVFFNNAVAQSGVLFEGTRDF